MRAVSNKYSGKPIDAVILWVDGNDPKLNENRKLYLKVENKSQSHSGALPTRFASSNEIRYCVLSIFRFAPFVRNIFVVTDEQDPNLYAEIETYFPDKSDCLKIVDHKEIFRGYEEYLPTFNSTTILSVLWRIKDLSENFVCFSDDVFLIREIQPGDWFKNNRPVLRGRWLLPPLKRIAGKYLKVLYNKYLRNNKGYQPRLSFYLRQWNAAWLIGFRFGYFFHCHTPHPQNRKILEKFFESSQDLLKKNISFRFRNENQYIMTSLAYHLEIRQGNKKIEKLNLGYLHPYYSAKRLEKKIKRCETDSSVKSVCAQSMDMFSKERQKRIFSWMDHILDLKSQV